MALSAGCGDDETASPATAPAADAGAGGLLTWALPARPRSLDPLFAETGPEQVVGRQIYEPLVAELGAPFESRRRLAGLALSALPSSDATVWRLRLRKGVRFQDGTPFNASAVLANAERWRASAQGRALLGESLVDAPRPDLVRFILPAADPSFDARLAAPALGIVSPRELKRAAGGELDPGRAAAAGTGAFELRERGGGRLLLARNTDWWGTDRGLGPGVDQLEFTVVPDPAERISLLGEGTIQVAGRLSPAELDRVRDDPLLTAVPQGGGLGLGIERSVRGIPPGETAPPLNGVWRTAVAPE